MRLARTARERAWSRLAARLDRIAAVQEATGTAGFWPVTDTAATAPFWLSLVANASRLIAKSG